MGRLLLAAAAAAIAAWTSMGAAQAQQWKYLPPPEPPWAPVPDSSTWPKSGWAMWENFWQSECRYYPKVNAYDAGGRRLAVYVHANGSLYAQCYWEREPERKVHLDPWPKVSPDEPWDVFNKRRHDVVEGTQLSYQPFVEDGTTARLSPQGNRNLCLDVPRGDLQEGAQLELHPCHNGDNQKFYWSWKYRGQIVAMPGHYNATRHPMCLDYYPAKGRSGDAVRIYTCHLMLAKKPTTQVWRPMPGAQLQSMTGKCLGSDNGFRGVGRAVMQDCPSDMGLSWTQH